MMQQRNLLSFVRALSEVSDDEIADFDRQGAAALLSALCRLHDDIGEAIVRLAPGWYKYSKNIDKQN